MNKVCFVISPIGEEGSKERKHADRVMNEIIKPIVGDKFGYDSLVSIPTTFPLSAT